MTKNIEDKSEEISLFVTLIFLLKTSDFIDKLNKKGPYTIFAPNNKAIKRLSRQTKTKVMNDKELLRKVLKYHIVPKKIMSKDIKEGQNFRTAEGHEITLSKNKVNNAKILVADIPTQNGVIHIINQVLMPGQKK